MFSENTPLARSAHVSSFLPSQQQGDAGKEPGHSGGGSPEIAIHVENLSKCYQIYAAPRDRLKQFIAPRLQRLLGQVPKQYYREFWALRDVTFEVRQGETVGIVGRNGSGKSTLLQLICGTLAPTSGSIKTRGRIAALLELGSGFNPEFTGRENVYMNAAVLGLSKAETNERFDDIAAFADIGQFIEQPVKTYSSGMYVRLAFAVNIMSVPEIMIVDEALAVGDMKFQAKCMAALTRVQDDGATVLFVSHDIDALKSLCSRGIYLEHGAIHLMGKAGEVAEHYTRKMREEMNAEHISAMPGTSGSEAQNAAASAKNPGIMNIAEFKTSVEFEKQVANSRYGEGGAKITFVELLDQDMYGTTNVEFDQAVFIRIYLEASIDDEVSCNYYVLDEKRNYILGAGLELAGERLLQIREGKRYIVTYKTRFPLQEGWHSIQLEITKPVIKDQTAIFLDVIDNALVFNMLRRRGSRLWAKAFVTNEVDIKPC